MVFEMSSTRTRVAFEAAMLQCGGSAIFLSPRDTQLGRGEPIQDTARVLSRMVDIVTIRTYEHDKLESFAAHSRVPVINALTDREHPCQLLADMQTYFEQRGDIRGRTVAWLGDGNNMCHSYIHAAQLEIGLHVSQQLAGVLAIGEGGDLRHARMGGEGLELVVFVGAEGDDVDHARQHARGVLYRLAAAELGVARREKDRAAAALQHRRFEGDARARRRHLEHHAKHLGALYVVG